MVKNESSWSEVLQNQKHHPVLENSLKVDVAIVGAGITGLTAAYLLSQGGLKVAILEKNSVGIQMQFFAQPPLGANAEAVTHQQHPNHQFWIDRRPSTVTVVWREVLAQVPEI